MRVDGISLTFRQLTIGNLLGIIMVTNIQAKVLCKIDTDCSILIFIVLCGSFHVRTFTQNRGKIRRVIDDLKSIK